MDSNSETTLCVLTFHIWTVLENTMPKWYLRFLEMSVQTNLRKLRLFPGTKKLNQIHLSN